MMVDTAHLVATIYGRVQGVFFRAFVVNISKKLGLTGYVRNLPDGTVEVKAEGDKQRLEELVVQLNLGPPGSRVDKVTALWSRYTGNYSDFNVRS
jgi:acylphosphatase